MLDPVELLREARRLANQTVKDHKEVQRWRRAVDEFLATMPNDDPTESYDTPDRVAQRAYVERMFRRDR